MSKAQKGTQSKSIPIGIGIGTGVSIASTLAAAAVLALLIASNKLAPTAMRYGVMVLLMVSSIIGAMVSNAKVKSKRIVVSMVTALCYFVTLLCITALLFDGMYQGVPATAMVIMGGGLIAGLLPSGQGSARHSRKRKKRYG